VRGGQPFVGEKGKITGVQAGQESLQQRVNQTKNSTSPAIIPDAEIISHQGKTLWRCGVANLMDKVL